MTILFCGLGGGLDVVNASLLYFLAKKEGKKCILGSVRPPAQEYISNMDSFSPQGCLLNGNSVIDTGKSNQRYAETKMAELLNEQVVFFSRCDESGENKKGLREAIVKAVELYSLTELFFVDGGGDSLVLKSTDVNSGSETTDPFAGGDAFLMSALEGVPNVYQCCISVGIDVDPNAFQVNLKHLDEKRAYFGRLNMKTLEKENFSLEKIFKGENLDFLEDYFEIAERVLILKEDHIKEIPNRFLSHTGTITYHALKGDFGICRTFVPWEPKRLDGSRGAVVREDYVWMYFFDMTKIEELKRELNK